MTSAESVAAVLAASGASRNLLTVHLWHIIEGVGFLVTSLGGIAVAEFIQGRRVHASGAAFQRVGPATGGVSAGGARSSVATAVGVVGRRQFLLPLVAVADAAAAGVHFVVMPTHFQESLLYGGFFAVAATMQVVYSVWLLARPSRALLTAGAVGNLAIALLWLYTRTSGIPLGPASGSTEPFGALDTLATGFELVGSVGAFALLRGLVRQALNPANWSRAMWLVAPAAAVAIAVTAYVWPAS
jgi:hypothetical protein